MSNKNMSDSKSTLEAKLLEIEEAKIVAWEAYCKTINELDSARDTLRDLMPPSPIKDLTPNSSGSQLDDSELKELTLTGSQLEDPLEREVYLNRLQWLQRTYRQSQVAQTVKQAASRTQRVSNWLNSTSNLTPKLIEENLETAAGQPAKAKLSKSNWLSKRNSPRKLLEENFDSHTSDNKSLQPAEKSQPSDSSSYKYKAPKWLDTTKKVRGRLMRKNLEGHSDTCCAPAYKAMGFSAEEVQSVTKHRGPKRPLTPPGYWDISWHSPVKKDEDSSKNKEN